ncbi:hypothetical protein GUJ93_ZPchr0004g38689 [Zizania palustris]|uniref:HMA domain-containing protein n=1 Tax=Zizania palustris TaxID=103762 RepID=A0A8J5RXS6_ZIZPA|nr:hypothetical protein GUJ93_ZPchr0004g38689 [Zizania palustris]
MPTLIITVDLHCCRCSTKIQKILGCMQERREFAIEKVVYEKNKVIVTGTFDAEKLCCKLWCKAGKFIVNIEIVKPPPPEKKEDKKEEKKPEPKQECKINISCPYPCPQQCCPPWPPCGCATSHCEPPAPKPPAHTPAHAKPSTCGGPTWPSCQCSTPCPPYPPTTMPYPYMSVCDDSPVYGPCAVM